MARTPEEQIADVESKIALSEDYARRIKKRANMLAKRLIALKEKFGIAPAPADPTADPLPQVDPAPVTAESGTDQDFDA